MYQINHQTCKNCNICIEVCPAKVIGKDAENNTVFLQDRILLCMKCGQCMAACETKFVQIDGFSYETDFFELPDETILQNNFYNFLSTRRSVRNFRKNSVEKEILQKILDAANFAPYGVDSQSFDIAVLTNPEVIKQSLPIMSEFYSKVGKWFKNPFMRYMISRNTTVQMFSTIKHLLKYIEVGHYDVSKGLDNITRNAPAIFILHAKPKAAEHSEDAVIAITYLMLAAHSLGLGAAIIGLIAPAINKFKELKTLFQVTQQNEAVISLIVGYPKFKYRRGIKRQKQNVNWVE